MWLWSTHRTLCIYGWLTWSICRNVKSVNLKITSRRQNHSKLFHQENMMKPFIFLRFTFLPIYSSQICLIAGLSLTCIDYIHCYAPWSAFLVPKTSVLNSRTGWLRKIFLERHGPSQDGLEKILCRVCKSLILE